MPLGFPPDGFASGLAYRPSPGDIFVASYPKCGTTWLQYIVWLLVRRRPLGADDSLTDAFPHLEEVGAGPLGALPEPRLIKTHLDFTRTPFEAAARYVVIARNPFDCVVSFFHHTRGFPQHYDFADGRFEDFFECFLAGEVDFGDYFAHLQSWQAETARDNVRLITYEALRANTAGTIRRIAAFLGPDAVDAVADEAALAAVIRETGLKSMQRDQQRWSSRRPDWAPAFVRKGIVGDWPSLFTPTTARRLLAECDRRLPGTGLDREWAEVLDAARAFAAGARRY
jgi:hypothetical protein